MIYLIIFIAIYLLSIWKVFNWIRNLYYHKKGKLFGLNPDTNDYLATFFPIINTTMALIFIFMSQQVVRKKMVR